MTIALALDPGYGGTKVYGASGGLNIPSAASYGDGRLVQRVVGLRSVRPPLRIETTTGAFYVGEGAHDWGRPVENLDLNRLVGAPEMRALFLGAMTLYGAGLEPITLIVGLPIAALMGEEAEAVKNDVRAFLKGAHSWSADGALCSMTVEEVLITSQPVGAMFDYLLTPEGSMTVVRKAAFQNEIAVLSIGMNTVDLLVVRNGAPVQRFTGGDMMGVRRLLELVPCRGSYSLAELDAQLRLGQLDIRSVLPIWQSEVMGLIERHWGREWHRFRCVVIVGGGAILLRRPLLERFKDKAFIPDDPLIATARGLYKFALMRGRRTGKHGETGEASES